jgi:hypothetical protein
MQLLSEEALYGGQDSKPEDLSPEQRATLLQEIEDGERNLARLLKERRRLQLKLQDETSKMSAQMDKMGMDSSSLSGQQQITKAAGNTSSSLSGQRQPAKASGKASSSHPGQRQPKKVASKAASPAKPRDSKSKQSQLELNAANVVKARKQPRRGGRFVKKSAAKPVGGKDIALVKKAAEGLGKGSG